VPFPLKSDFPHSTPSGLVFKIISGCEGMPLEESSDSRAGVSSFNVNLGWVVALLVKGLYAAFLD
jgi:hypothetical protein